MQEAIKEWEWKQHDTKNKTELKKNKYVRDEEEKMKAWGCGWNEPTEWVYYLYTT